VILLKDKDGKPTNAAMTDMLDRHEPLKEMKGDEFEIETR